MSYGRGTCRVLVVEDDPLSRRALAALLEHLGCSCCTARSYAEASALLDGQTHVITDLLLTNSTGADLLKLIRRRGLSHHVAVVTALDRDHDLVRSVRQLEPEVLLRKPIDVEALLGWLDHSRS
jgi:CheY-like chemotaxis protein